MLTTFKSLSGVDWNSRLLHRMLFSLCRWHWIKYIIDLIFTTAQCLTTALFLGMKFPALNKPLNIFKKNYFSQTTLVSFCQCLIVCFVPVASSASSGNHRLHSSGRKIFLDRTRDSKIGKKYVLYQAGTKFPINPFLVVRTTKPIKVHESKIGKVQPFLMHQFKSP